MEFEVVTSAERPDLEDAARDAFRERWPEFIFHDNLSNEYTPQVADRFPQYDIMLLASESVAAGGWGVPLRWDGSPGGLPSGYRDALVAAIDDHDAGRASDTFCFMAAAVNREFDKQGLATRVLAALTERALDAGLERVVAPIRPTLKHRYPQVPMERYAAWSRPDGESIDPWIRTHVRMGASVLGVAADSMIVSGTVADWEGWAGMPFPESGAYVVPEALNLVEVDVPADVAVYREENLWVRHR